MVGQNYTLSLFKRPTNIFRDTCHSLWSLIATVFSNQARVVSLASIKERHVVKAAVDVGLQDELIKRHLDYLVHQSEKI